MELKRIWKRGGPGRPVAERFWEKVDRSGGATACWKWMAADIGNGYGTFAETPYKRTLAHRMAWQLTHGKSAPVGMDLCHSCDNRQCVNPAHLFVGTRKDNIHDCIAKGRSAKGERHGRSRLTQDDVRWIREWRAAGWSPRLLAIACGVHQSHISHICAGRAWRQGEPS